MTQMDRRAMMIGAGAAGLLAGCEQRMASLAPPGGAPSIDGPFAPVAASKDRVVRTIVGLRPYRATGFRLEAEGLGAKPVVHNYGHGGAGVPLSWGCAEWAAETALAALDRTGAVAVLGAGVMGLTTARVLQRRGARVTLYAAGFPPDTTSNIAGALWYPTTLYDPDKADPAFRARLDHVSRRSFNVFQTFANDPRYGVFWIRHHQLFNDAVAGPIEPMPGGDALYPGLRRRQSGRGPFGMRHWGGYYTLMIDPDIYLRALVNDVTADGGRLVARRFRGAADIAALDEQVVVNCTGLGAATLVGDPDLIPARGQLTLLLPQPEINYGYATASAETGVLYMFPRRSSLVLGGSVDYGDSDLRPRPDEIDRMLAGHKSIAARA